MSFNILVVIVILNVIATGSGDVRGRGALLCLSLS